MSSPVLPLVDRHARVRSILPRDWWKVSYRSVSWSFAKDKRALRPTSSMNPSTACPKPPHYHDSLFRERWRQITKETPPATESELDQGLVGVEGAVEVLQAYERDVGMFTAAQEEPAGHDRRALFGGDLDEIELAMAQKRWDDRVRDLFGDALLRVSSCSLADVPEEDKDSWDLDIVGDHDSSSIRRASPGLTESSGSTDSDLLPSTPKTGKMSYADVVFPDRRGSPSSDEEAAVPSLKHPSAYRRGASASTSLSSGHSASSSVPSRQTPSPISTFDEFEFPSLNTKPKPTSLPEPKSALPTRLQKDENGFYYNPAGPMSPTASEARPSARSVKRASAALLPAFLADGAQPVRTRNSSRTRELVDRLRSSSSTRDVGSRGRRMDLSGPRASLPSVQDVDEAAETDGKPLGSCPPGYKVAPVSDVDGWITGVIHEKITQSEDTVPEHGWISGPSAPRTPSRTRGQGASNATSSATTPTSTESFSLPPTPAMHTPFYPGIPPTPFSVRFPHASIAHGVPFFSGQAPWQTGAVGHAPFATYSWAPPVPPAGSLPFPAATSHILYEAQGKTA